MCVIMEACAGGVWHCLHISRYTICNHLKVLCLSSSCKDRGSYIVIVNTLFFVGLGLRFGNI